MPGGRPRRVNCRRCELHTSECGPLSARGFCDTCGVGESINQQFQLNAHGGYHFNRWRAKTIAAAGGIVPDELKPYLERE